MVSYTMSTRLRFYPTVMTLKTDLSKSDNSSGLNHWIRSSFVGLVECKIKANSAKGAECQLDCFVVVIAENII